MIYKQIHKTLKYFHFFTYAPTFNEIYTFISTKTTEAVLRQSLACLQKTNKLKQQQGIYTIGEYSIIQRTKIKNQKSKVKIHSIAVFVKILSLFPQVKLVGLSGSVAMMNAEEDDDIDIFIITGNKRTWTARFIALSLAQLFGRRRKFVDNFAKDKICLNLYFDESNMIVPKKKRTEYVAHEVLQMKPLYTSGNTYMRYLDANKWIYDIFPNAKKSKIRISKSETMHTNNSNNSDNFQNSKLLRIFIFVFQAFMNQIELFLKSIQLYFINKHRTSEIITDTQLWFFPEDFETKLKKELSK